MKKKEAIFKPFKLDEIKEALEREKIQRFYFSEIRGAGSQEISVKQYRGVGYAQDTSEVSIGMIVEDDDADLVAQLLVTTLRSGDLSDAEVLFCQ